MRNKYKTAIAAGLLLTANTMPHRHHHHRHHHHHYTKHERYLMRQTAFGEGRGDGYKGMIAVVHVIINRDYAGNCRLFGCGIAHIVHKRYQFTSQSPNDPNYALIHHPERIMPGTPDAVAWAEAGQIVDMIADHKTADPTRGATYYYATWIKAPWWSKAMTYVASFGGQRFYVPETAHA